jgi:two-component system, response regulator
MHHMKTKILLVEDNPDDAALAIRMARRNNLANEVVVVTDGEAALDLLLHARELPEIVLLDLGLPRMHGLDVLRRIRAEESTKRVPVVILTGSGDEQHVIEGYAAGANAYLRKPVDFVQFTNAVKILGLHWFVVSNASLPRVASPRP